MKYWKPVLLVAIFALVAASIVICGSEKVISRAIALSSIFTGLLTLTGFMFTARTFITFKLNELVYDKPTYRKSVEEQQATGAYSMSLYEPLKVLDSKVGRASLQCFVTLFFVLAFSMIPREWGQGHAPLIDSCKEFIHVGQWPWKFLTYEFAAIFVFVMAFAIIVEVFSTILTVNLNIRSIIQEWEKGYEAAKK
jgi:hypothetical protein